MTMESRNLSAVATSMMPHSRHCSTALTAMRWCFRRSVICADCSSFPIFKLSIRTSGANQLFHLQLSLDSQALLGDVASINQIGRASCRERGSGAAAYASLDDDADE